MSKDDLDPKSGTIQPATYTTTREGATVAGQEVIRQHSAYIDRFVTAQRSMVNNSSLNQHRQSTDHPDISIEYHYSFGHERIHLDPKVQPVEIAPQPEEKFPEYGPTSYFEVFEPNLEYPVPCMLVLYQQNKIAAFPMLQLSRPEKLAPIYRASLAKTKFPQTISACQILVAGVSFIMTDVDLSGTLKNRKPDNDGDLSSVLSTTLIFDAVDIGKKYIPILASDKKPTDKLQQGEMPTIYTPQGSYKLDKGKLKIAKKLARTEQCAAIDGTSGTYYFNPNFDSEYVKINMKDCDVNVQDVNPDLVKTEQEHLVYVMAYTLNYIRYTDTHSTSSYDDTSGPIDVVIGHDPVSGADLIQRVYPEGWVRHDKTDGTERIVVVSTPIPNEESDQPKEHEGYYNISETVGSTYYAKMHVDEQSMSAKDLIKFAYGNVYYYTYYFKNNLFENLTMPEGAAPSQHPEFTNEFPRMIWDDEGKISKMQMDTITGTAKNTYSLYTPFTQIYPEWGGLLIDGLTIDTDTPVIEHIPDIGDVTKHTGSHSKQIVSHSTVKDRLPNHGYINATYDDAKLWVDDIVAEIQQGLDDFPNGPSGDYSGNIGSHRDQTATSSALFPDPYSGRPVDSTVTYTDTGDIVTGSGTGKQPPGYKAQFVSRHYEAHLDWVVPEIDGVFIMQYKTSTPFGLEDHDAEFKETSIECLAFPYGTKDKVFAMTYKQRGTASNPVYSYVTPYDRDNPVTDKDQIQLTGWLHISNAKYLLQGWTVKKKIDNIPTPYLYLNGNDIMSYLTQALRCKREDISACYFDIGIDQIKLLSKIM